VPRRHPARKRFILVGFGIGILIVVFIGLFTDIGTNSGSSGNSGTPSAGGQPQPGDPVPSFTGRNIGPRGGATVAVSSRGSGRAGPTVLLFFGNWCDACHRELPPLAAAVRQQDAGGGPLSHIRIVGVDSLDKLPRARAFIKSSGVTFPVAYDPDVTITEGAFYLRGDPYTVFVGANGRIAQIAYGDTLTLGEFTADEQALIPSGT
jgi:peroxiredoxin